MIDKIQMAYGFLSEETKDWVNNNLQRLSENDRANYMDYLAMEWPKRKGIPNKETLQKVLTKITGKGPKKYFWAVCMECGCEYDFDLPMCPACYKKGLECRMKAVTVSDNKPPAKVIRYNKQYFSQEEKICYDYEFTELSFCYHFGQTDWECRNLSSCKCASCCIKIKRANEKLKTTDKEQIHYAKPLSIGKKL
jgi:hypothetical protein